MIIHIGEGISLFKKDIMMIIDKKSMGESLTNQKILQESYRVNPLDEAKAYIVTRNNEIEVKSKYKIYESNISAKALFKRSDKGY